MDVPRETPPADPMPGRSEPRSEAPNPSNGAGAPVNLEPGPEETVFRGIFPGSRDPDRT